MSTKMKSPSRDGKRRIFLIDDHPVLRDGLRRLLESESDLLVCGEAENAKRALERIPASLPEIAIVDISLPGMDGIELIKSLKARFPDLRLLMLSMHDEALYAERALRAGAKGALIADIGTSLQFIVLRMARRFQSLWEEAVKETQTKEERDYFVHYQALWERYEVLLADYKFDPEMIYVGGNPMPRNADLKRMAETLRQL